MITIKKDIYIENDTAVYALVGLSTDVKPTGNINGSSFYEMDTGKTFYYNGENDLWIEKTEKYLVSLSFDKEAFTNTYSVGDTIDTESLDVTAFYSDNTFSTVTDYDYLPAAALTADDKECIVIYTENGVTRTDKAEITVS